MENKDNIFNTPESESVEKKTFGPRVKIEKPMETVRYDDHVKSSEADQSEKNAAEISEQPKNGVIEEADILSKAPDVQETTKNEDSPKVEENIKVSVTDDVSKTESSDGLPKKRHKTTKWFVAVFVALFLVFLIPVITVGVIVFTLPPVYDKTYMGVLGDKYERLKSIDEPKVVIVGGSSVAFGIDSALMEEKLGMKVVNFGLYANLGTKLMLDLSKANINEGDIIIIAPEMSDQTLSLYFNAETFMQALDGNPSMLLNIDSKNYESIVGASWKFAYEKLNYLVTDTRPQNSGAYAYENFSNNEYFDNKFDRPYNEMTQTTNVINLNFRTDYTDDKETEYEEYIDYLNKYISFANRKGATVYYSLCPMNKAALGAKNNADVIYEYYRNLVNSVNCKVISNVNDYLMDEGYFFDSEFHLNNAGVTVRTVKLIDDIKRERGILTQTMPVSDLPAPPGFKPADKVESGVKDNPYFVLDEVQGKTEVYYKVVGLTEEGKKQTKLEIISAIEVSEGVYIPIRVIGADALLGNNVLEELVLSENITAIEGKAFNGAMALKRVIIPDGKDAVDISVPNTASEALITDDVCCPDLKIYVDEKFYESFAGDYFWGDYGTRLTAKTK